MTTQILRGNCRELLAQLPAASVHCCVSSPPYWSLRDYGTEPVEWPEVSYSPMAGLPPITIPAMRASLGLEPTLESFIGHMVLVYREVRRVLRDDGTAWVNMGDSYARDPGKGGSGPGKNADYSDSYTEAQRRAAGEAGVGRRENSSTYRVDGGLKPKDMVGQPWRLAFALQADGWWLRSDVIWHKKNPMPESTKDRLTKAHEYVFLLAKSESYYFDHDAIKEPASPDTHARYARGRSDDHKHAGDEHAVPGMRQQTIAKSFAHMRKPVAGWATGEGSHSAIEHAQQDDQRQHKLLSPKYGELTGQDSDGVHRTKANLNRRKLAEDGSGTKNNGSFDAAMAVMPEDRAKRTVWSISTEGYADAHFATYPTELVKPCILAGCPEGGTVLDPFGGSGTTAVVADRLGRHAILCELNPSYASMAHRRVTNDAGLFAEVRIE